MIVILSLIVVLILILFLYNKDLFHRDTVITIVTSLPLGIFKDEKSNFSFNMFVIYSGIKWMFI